MEVNSEILRKLENELSRALSEQNRVGELEEKIKAEKGRITLAKINKDEYYNFENQWELAIKKGKLREISNQDILKQAERYAKYTALERESTFRFRVREDDLFTPEINVKTKTDIYAQFLYYHSWRLSACEGRKETKEAGKKYVSFAKAFVEYLESNKDEKGVYEIPLFYRSPVFMGHNFKFEFKLTGSEKRGLYGRFDEAYFGIQKYINLIRRSITTVEKHLELIEEVPRLRRSIKEKIRKDEQALKRLEAETEIFNPY